MGNACESLASDVYYLLSSLHDDNSVSLNRNTSLVNHEASEVILHQYISMSLVILKEGFSNHASLFHRIRCYTNPYLLSEDERS